MSGNEVSTSVVKWSEV